MPKLVLPETRMIMREMRHAGSSDEEIADICDVSLRYVANYFKLNESRH
jgi:hypothetical protein